MRVKRSDFGADVFNQSEYPNGMPLIHTALGLPHKRLMGQPVPRKARIKGPKILEFLPFCHRIFGGGVGELDP